MATNIDLEALKRLRGGLNPIAPEDAIFNDAPAQARGMDMVPVPVQKLDISQVPSRPDPTATDSQPSDLTRTLMALNSPADPQPAPPSATGSNGVDPKIRKYLVGESTPLQASLPTGQPLAIPQGEAAPVKAAPVERDELREAQARADAAMGRAQFGGEMNQALNLMTHHQMDEGSDLYKREGDDAQRSVKNVLQRREAARQGFADKVNQVEGQNKMDMFDPNSALSKQAAAIDLQAGLITPEQYKSGMFTAAMHPLLKEGADFSTAQKRTALQDRKEADASAEDTRYHKDVIALGYAKLNADRKREKAEKAPSDIPIKEQHAVEAEGKVPAAVGKLEAARQQIPWYQAAIKASHFGSYGEQAAYDRILTDEAPNALGASAADARITPAMINQFTGNAPGYFANAEQASAHWNTLKENAAKARDENLAVLKAGNHNPAQIQELEARSAPSAAQSAGRSVTGYSYNKDRSKRIPVYSDGTKGQPEPSNG